MKITVQIDGEEVALATTVRSVAPAEILEKAKALGAEDAGPAPALTLSRGAITWYPSEEMEQAAFSTVPSIDCGEAPKQFQRKAASGVQAEATSTEPTEAQDAGKAAQR
jgi:hypothetical protein